MSFFSEEKRSIRKDENNFKSDDVEFEAFSYQQGVLRGKVQASMKKKVYKVTASLLKLSYHLVLKALDRVQD